MARRAPVRRFRRARSLAAKPGFALLAILLAFPYHRAAADEPKPAAMPKPQAILSIPLAVMAGQSKLKLTLRGLALDEATAVKVEGAPLTVSLTGKGKAGVPDKMNAARVGDTQVELEVSLPADAPAGAARLVIVTPKGESPPYVLPVLAAGALAEKKPPAAGFRDATPLPVGQTLLASIEQAKGVYVFRFHATKDQRFTAEVFAARQGSALDPLLTIYDARAHLLAQCDDLPAQDGQPASADSRLIFRAPAEGDYFLSLSDAHDSASPLHVFRLHLASP